MYTECQFLNRIDRIYYFILYVPFKSTSPLKIVFHSTLSLNHSVFFLLLWFLSCPYLYLIRFTTGTTYFVQSCTFWLHTRFPASHLKTAALAVSCLALLFISRVFQPTYLATISQTLIIFSDSYYIYWKFKLGIYTIGDFKKFPYI